MGKVSNKLLVQDRGDGSVRFTMNVVEVDGIVQRRDNRNVIVNYMFTFKYEDTESGNPNDTGKAMNWSPIEVSEKHWLRCGTVIPKHSTCLECGERDLDE